MHPFISESVAVLERTPRVLAALLDGAPEAWTETRESDASFSPRDVVGHLIHGEDTDWVPRLRLILEKGDSEPFVPFDRFGFRDRIAGRTLADLLEEFTRKREANVGVLRDLSLDDADLARAGRHPALGAVTLRQLLATRVAHDLNHVGQAVRVMARRHTEAVGPWRAYLKILGRPQEGRVLWNDLTVGDAEGLRDFYSAVAGWRAEPVAMGDYADYNMIPRDSSDPAAGVCHARAGNAALPPVWLPYIAVASLDEAMARCRERGGRVVDGPRAMGEGRRYCVIQDPAGAHAGLVGP
jgi:predicted enzyme related to lactoylglutathione lyase